MHVFVIAEAGVNHQGNFQTALELAYAAKESGADAVKFQLFKDRPAIEHLRLREDQIFDIAAYCKSIDLEFMCTPFYLEAVAFLDPLVKRHKIASSWVHQPEILDAAKATGKQVIVSLGMGGVLTWTPKLSALHCVSKYPCPDKEANLYLAQNYAGYSDHTVGTVACLAAVARGAQIIEKHFTFDKTQTGPDHICSAEPEEFKNMVRDIRRIEVML